VPFALEVKKKIIYQLRNQLDSIHKQDTFQSQPTRKLLEWHMPSIFFHVLLLDPTFPFSFIDS
jgi:hypothetical protein